MSFDFKIVNGDLSIKNAQLETVTDSEKLIQDLLKICLTRAGSNSLNPWYGSFLSRTIIGSPEDTTVLFQIGKTQLYNAIQNLQKLQEMQVKSFQNMTADEQINAILDISIVRNRINPTLVDVRIKVANKGYKMVNAQFNISLVN